MLPVETTLVLALAAFFAGLVDAVAGGGGLVQLPALLGLVPNASMAVLFGTNKASSIAGTAIATVRYARAGALPFSRAWPDAAAAFPASYVGALAVRAVDPSVLRPLVLGLLGLVLVVTLRRPTTEVGAAPDATRARGMAIGAVMGFYDGFFGPGTGTFLVFAFARFLGIDFLRATARAKLVNLSTNLAALLAFGWHGEVLWQLAAPMAAANVAGAYVGTKLAIEGGAPVVRRVFLVVVAALLAKLAFDLVRGG